MGIKREPTEACILLYGFTSSIVPLVYKSDRSFTSEIETWRVKINTLNAPKRIQRRGGSTRSNPMSVSNSRSLGSEQSKNALLAILAFAVVSYLILLNGLSVLPGGLVGEHHTTGTLQKDALINHQSTILLSSSAAPPEDLETIEFCAEKCRYVPAMCDGLHRDRLALPAPSCLNYSLNLEDDIYWQDYLKSGENSKSGITYERNKKTVKLVDWAAGKARERRRQKMQSTGDESSMSTHCESVPTNNTVPMMWPED